MCALLRRELGLFEVFTFGALLDLNCGGCRGIAPGGPDGLTLQGVLLVKRDQWSKYLSRFMGYFILCRILHKCD